MAAMQLGYNVLLVSVWYYKAILIIWFFLFIQPVRLGVIGYEY